MPIESQQGEIAERLRRFFRVRGRIPSRLDELVVPMVELARLHEDPWQNFQRAVAWSSVTAVAATFQLFGVRAGAADVAVVRRLVYSQGALGRLAVHFRNVNLGGAGYSTGNLDNVANRETHPRASSGTAAFSAAALAGTTQVMEVRTLQDTPIVLELNWVLFPGDILFAGPHVANISFEATFFYDIYPTADLSQQIAG